MPEVITTAGAAGTDAAGAGTPSAPQVSPEDARVARAAAAAFGQPAADPTQSGAITPPEHKVTPFGTPKTPAEPPLAEVIRANREARQKAQEAETKRTSVETELKATREELARIKADRAAFEADPVGYAKTRKWTPEQQLLYGQSLLYDLAPDKADPDFRMRMFEDRQKREAAERERAEADAEVQEQQEAQQAAINQFYQDTAAAVRTFEAGSFPESEAWFGDDMNSYLQSLVATARNVSMQAQKNGQVADLSPAALARRLEVETARRMADRDSRKQARSPQRAAAVAPAAHGAEQSADTMSTRNMTGSGSPRPPASSVKERIQRAAEAAFRQK